MKRIYLDYAATTPLRAVARDAMLPWLGVAANASSLHYEGRQARQALDDARESFAAVLALRPREILFTASGSESVSLGLIGSMGAHGANGCIITSRIEHRAVLAAASEMAARGWQHVEIDVDGNGGINMSQLRHILASLPVAQPKLLSLMLVNNELGTVNDVQSAAACAREYGAMVHCDAIGCGALTPFAQVMSSVDLLSLAAHKFGGPVGVGVLAVRSNAAIVPTIFGGGQEFGKRAGTENVAAIVGAAAALRETEASRQIDAASVRALRDGFEDQIRAGLPNVRVLAHSAERAPSITNIAVPDLAPDVLPVALDLAGVAAAAGSACASGALQRSHVLEGIGYLRGAAVRFSWGRESTAEATDDAAELFIATVRRARTG